MSNRGFHSTPLKEYDGDIFDCVVLDGSNVITVSTPTTKGNRRSLSVSRLVRTLQAVQKLGWPTLVGMKRRTFRFAVSSKNSNLGKKDREILDELHDSGVLSLISDERDDDWLIRASVDNNGWILSNDRYLKEVKKLAKKKSYELANEINKRRCVLEFIGSEPVFLLPANFASMSLTSTSKREIVERAVRSMTEVQTRVIGDNGEYGLAIPVGKPVGRALLGEVAKDEEVRGISRVHFILNYTNGVLTITDLGSMNGTVVNGLSIAPNFPCELSTEEVSSLQIGSIEIKIQYDV
ncbi:MAG TPA: FHA domain-containing protein, partial [Gemmatimonadetes bacterium]|nr:FHA domain-containing protein [Gemmatimonadota bacterium]